MLKQGNCGLASELYHTEFMVWQKGFDIKRGGSWTVILYPKSLLKREVKEYCLKLQPHPKSLFNAE